MAWQKNYSLKEFNTFGLDEKASFFNSFSSLKELDSALNSKPNKELFVLGGGSNMLLTDTLDKAVLHNQLKGIHVKEKEDHVLVTAAGGEVWHDLVLYCVERNWGGLENLSLIPGSVGAAPIQNIGAYGVELKDTFVQLEAFNISSRKIEVFTAKDCAFAYRESVFKRKLKGKYIITSVQLKLSKSPVLNTSYGAISDELSKLNKSDFTIQDVSDAVIHIRQSKLPNPAQIGNSGSFFKNPIVDQEKAAELIATHSDIPNYPAKDKVKISAGWLIEKAGWKGFRRGDAGVHAKQALVLVNYGNARGAEIWKLAQEIIVDVELKFGIQLEPEVNIL